MTDLHIEAAMLDKQIQSVSYTPKLPFTFEVNLPTNLAGAITVLQTTNSLNFTKLPSALLKMDVFEETSQQKLLKLQPDIHLVLKSFLTDYFLVALQLPDSEPVSAIMHHFYGNCYLIVEVEDFKDLLGSEDKVKWSIKPIRSRLDLLETRLKGSTSKTVNAETFSMRPPLESTLPKEIPALDELEDPLGFIMSRYFSTLYSLNTPLSYFLKMALIRFRNLCNNDTKLISQLLEKLILSVEEMDDRNIQKYGILDMLKGTTKETDDDGRAKYESLGQRELISKNASILRAWAEDSNKSSIGDEKVQQLFLELKIREAQLQILLCLELLDCWKIDEASFITDSQAKWEKERRKQIRESAQPMVRKRKSKRKVVPTFLGMGVNVATLSVSSAVTVTATKTIIDELSVFKVFDTIIDRMGVWDTLLGRTAGNENDSAYGFLAFVLVPYFNKRLPLIIKYTIDKVKDSNMKLVTKSFRAFEKEARHRQKGSPDAANLDAAVQVSLAPAIDTGKSSSRSSKYKKVLLAPNKVPALRNSKTSSLSNSTDDAMLPAFSLKRSKSNLSSKNLQKREVDISVSKQDSVKLVQEGTNEDPTNSFIFGKAKKVKSSSQVGLKDSASLSRTFSQVQATPAKSKVKEIPKFPQDHFSRVGTTAMNGSGSSQIPSFSQITATPVKKDKMDSIRISKAENGGFSQIEATPIKARSVIAATPGSTSSIVQSARKDIGGQLLAAFEDNEFKSPTRFAKTSQISDHMLQRTPVERIQSSPISTSSSSRRQKPGQPASVQDSPFYSANLENISPEHTISLAAKRTLQFIDATFTPKKQRVEILEKPLPNIVQIVEASQTLNQGIAMNAVEEETDNDSEYDSDYERLISKTPTIAKAQKTYTKSAKL